MWCLQDVIILDRVLSSNWWHMHNVLRYRCITKATRTTQLLLPKRQFKRQKVRNMMWYWLTPPGECKEMSLWWKHLQNLFTLISLILFCLWEKHWLEMIQLTSLPSSTSHWLTLQFKNRIQEWLMELLWPNLIL